MNQAHLEFLASPAWARWLETELLPWLLTIGDLGDDLLEIGPGPGLTTDLLRARVPRMTAVELDSALASALVERMTGTNVEVVHADATASGLPSDRFSAAACFSMLHHIPTPADQNRLFAEVYRVLRPGGTFVATDSKDLDVIRVFHEQDVFVPLDPDELGDRLGSAGFTTIEVSPTGFEIRFSAKKPATSGQALRS
jgi:SAM-dependent methyltransferase